MDIVTCLMIWAAEATTLGLLLWSRWFYDRQSYFRSWGAGFVLHGLGVGLVGLRGSLPEFLSVEIANTIALSGAGLWIAGTMQFDNRRVDPYIAIPALIWVAGMFLNPIRETFAFRVALFHCAATVGYLMLIAVMLSGQHRRSMTRRVLATFISVQAASGLTVAALALAYRPTSFSTDTRSVWLLLAGAFCFVAAVMSGAKLINERSEAKLKRLADTDPLTGALNRRGLISEFHRLKASAPADAGFLALIHFDLDGFKQINDLYGHQAGDEVLVAFARIGMASHRGRGSFGRMGGEEFASILHVANMIEAASISEAIRTTLKRLPVVAGEHRISVTVSAGIALADANGADLDMLLSAADQALYAAKTDGRDRSAIGTGRDIMIVPAIDHIYPDKLTDNDVAAPVDVSRQVTALRLIATVGK